MIPPRRFGGYSKLAQKLATSSEYGNFRHGAVLEKGSAILGLGVNNEKYSSVGAKFRHSHKGHSTYHAEISAVLGLDRCVTKGATIYVVRASKKDGSMRMSKPCDMCHAVLKERGVARVVYSVDETTNGTYKF